MAAKLVLLAILSAFAFWAWVEDDVPGAYGVSAGLAGVLLALSDKWSRCLKPPGA